MRFFIMGASGLIGQSLASHLTSSGCQVQVLLRNEKQKSFFTEQCEFLIGDPLKAGPWQAVAGQSNVLVNLVGKSVFTRWNEQIKKDILHTRVAATKRAVQAIAKGDQDTKPVLINASAVGYYPMQTNKTYTEKDLPGSHFLAQVCQMWEKEALKARELTRVILARFAPVISPKGGILKKTLPLFKSGLGGRLGKGTQSFPWIQIKDLVRALEWVAKEPSVNGPVNMVSAQQINNIQFTEALARAVHRPALLTVPAMILRLFFGELSLTLLQGAKVQPKVLQEHAFQFTFPTIYAALHSILS